MKASRRGGSPRDEGFLGRGVPRGWFPKLGERRQHPGKGWGGVPTGQRLPGHGAAQNGDKKGGSATRGTGISRGWWSPGNESPQGKVVARGWGYSGDGGERHLGLLVGVPTDPIDLLLPLVPAGLWSP